MKIIERTSSIHYEAHFDGAKEDSFVGALPNKVLLPGEIDRDSSYDARANKRDCLIASACGILTGLLDVLWVGDFSLSDAQALGREQVNRMVIKIASSQGCPKDSLEESIRFLEKAYANPSDKLTPEFGGGLQHHLRDFSHHASPVGLICSILAQFTEKGYGTDTEGKLITPDIPRGAHIGKNFEEKIVYGIVHWAFHLISDMAGSSNNPGNGTGIPGPLLSLLKELSVLPIIRDFTTNYKGTDISLSVWISKLFNGTAFRHEGSKDLIRFDLRTEIGIADYGVRQTVPVIINQCLVRAFYCINRLCQEITENRIESVKDLNKIDPGRVLPFNNRCIARMITISSGTFSVIDTIDAAVRAKMHAGTDKASFAKSFLLRINLIGIANFAIAIKNDAKNLYQDVKDAFSGKENKHTLYSFIETQEININVEMDNTAIYRYQFDALLQTIKRRREFTDERKKGKTHERRLVFDIRTPEFDEYDETVFSNESIIMLALEHMIGMVFDENGISYEKPKGYEKSLFTFIRTFSGKRVGYVFGFSQLTCKLSDLITLYAELKNNTDVDEARVFFAVNAASDSDTYITSLNDHSTRECNSFFRFATLKDFFDDNVRKGEYDVFKSYVDEFNEKVKNVIAFKTVIIPTEEKIALFKAKKLELLQSFDYEAMLPASLYDNQKRILRKNFLDRGTYQAMLGEMDFADSFITSEWNYDVNLATGVLDQTGVVAGYLKSIEQLLYAVVMLSINKGKTIRFKNGDYGELNSDNKQLIDSTLGSLTYFVKKNDNILDVNNYVKKFIISTLFTWIDADRNGLFHKDNLHDTDKVAEIRKQTMLLYYLILGGFSIKNDDFRKIGIHEKKHDVVDEEELYQQFKSWASPIILHEVPKNTKTVLFHVSELIEKSETTIDLLAMRELVESNDWCTTPLLYSSHIMENYFRWKNTLGWEECLCQVSRFVEKLLSDEEPASKLLRSIPRVIIADINVVKTFIHEE